MRIEKLILICSLAACGASQDATPSTPSPKPTATTATCDGGDLVFQIDRRNIERRPDDRVSSLAIRSSGAWTFDALDNGKLVRKQGGCLAAADLTKLRTAIDAAPWKTTRPDAVCEIMIIERTEYRVGNRLVWTAMGCAGDTLDDDSKKALDAALAIVSGLRVAT